MSGRRWLIGVVCLPALFQVGCGGPIVERPALREGDTFAIVVSGDGGWRAIDRDISGMLNDNGVSVAGVVAPDFFAQRKTTAEAAHLLDQMIVAYATRWKRSRVILVGYSRGAGVLPFMISRLSPAARARIGVVALLGLDPFIDFKTSPKVLLWRADDDLTIPVVPELRKLRGLRVLCISGADDRDSICRALPSDLATPMVVTGGHHFGGAYRAIASMILSAARGPATKGR